LNEEFIVKTLTVDEFTYIGIAPRGSATSEAVWRIKRIEDITGGIIRLYAEGSDKYEYVFDDYATYTYS